MKRYSCVKGVAALLGLILSALTLSAQAAQDRFWVSNVNTVTVDGSAVGFTSSPDGSSNNRQLSITEPIEGAKAIDIEVVWSVAAGSAPRTTSYPNNGVAFPADTVQGTPVDGLTVTPDGCDVATEASSCTTTVSFTTPNVEGNIALRVSADTPQKTPGNTRLQGRDLDITLSVIEEVQQAQKLDTDLQLLPAPHCFLYGAGDVQLSAALTELLSGEPVSGRAVHFSVADSYVDTSHTDSYGQAALTYNIDDLFSGDYPLYAAFDGDADYKPNNNSSLLGISYHFVGFLPPINPQGNSIFGNGRVIPVKVKLVDALLNPVTDAEPTVWIYQWAPGTGLGEVPEAATSVSAADSGNTMRYVPEDKHYIYNWDLSSLDSGTYAVVVELGDSAACSTGPYYATITVEKRGGKK